MFHMHTSDLFMGITGHVLRMYHISWLSCNGRSVKIRLTNTCVIPHQLSVCRMIFGRMGMSVYEVKYSSSCDMRTAGGFQHYNSPRNSMQQSNPLTVFCRWGNSVKFAISYLPSFRTFTIFEFTNDLLLRIFHKLNILHFFLPRVFFLCLAASGLLSAWHCFLRIFLLFPSVTYGPV